MSDVLDKYDAMIEREVKRYFSQATEEARRYHPFIGRLYEVLAEYVLRKGRRLATTSALLIYSGYTGEVDDAARKLGLALELYRHAILVHDDLVDRDSERRGGKALHLLFEPESFGEATAIFAGNMLYAMALEVLEGTPQSDELRSLFARAYREVNESQVLDAYFEQIEPGVEEWYAMASRRAPSLFRLTLLAGATLAGAEQEERELLRRAGTEIGYAFDIQDDIIGTFATREQYGREPGGDVLRGKKPLHVVLALKHAPEDEREELLRILSLRSAGEEEVERVREIVRSCGALDEARRIAQQHAASAKAEISKTSLSEEVKQTFASFIDYVVESLDWYA